MSSKVSYSQSNSLKLVKENFRNHLGHHKVPMCPNLAQRTVYLFLGLNSYPLNKVRGLHELHVLIGLVNY